MWIVSQLDNFHGLFISFVTILCNSGERDALFLLYLNQTIEIYRDEMGHSCLVGVLINAEQTVPAVTVRGIANVGIRANQANQTRSRPQAGQLQHLPIPVHLPIHT